MLDAAACDKYDAFVRHYQMHVYPLLAAKFLGALGARPESVLDLGVGPGYLSVHLAKLGVERIHGVDINPRMLDLVQRNIGELGAGTSKIELSLQDAHQLAFDSHTFDLVVSYSCYHHWTSPVAVLKECTRVLRSNGSLILVDTHRHVVDPANILKTSIDPDAYQNIVQKALSESLSVAEVREHHRHAGLEDGTVGDLEFSDEELMGCIDYLDDAPQIEAGAQPATATCWIAHHRIPSRR